MLDAFGVVTNCCPWFTIAPTLPSNAVRAVTRIRLINSIKKIDYSHLFELFLCNNNSGLATRFLGVTVLILGGGMAEPVT